MQSLSTNLLRPDSTVSLKAVTPSLAIRCPHCMTVGIFYCPMDQELGYSKILLDTSGGTKSVSMKCSVRMCPNSSCFGIVFIFGEKNGEYQVLPPERIGFDPEEIPTKLLATLEEAIACHAAGAFRASAMIVRRLLEEICEDAGAMGKNLHERLQALRGNVVLPEELFEAMQELKALGNDAAHIDAKAFDSIGAGEASDSIELAKEILKARYQLKGLLERLRSRRSSLRA